MNKLHSSHCPKGVPDRKRKMTWDSSIVLPLSIWTQQSSSNMAAMGSCARYLLWRVEKRKVNQTLTWDAYKKNCVVEKTWTEITCILSELVNSRNHSVIEIKNYKRVFVSIIRVQFSHCFLQYLVVNLGVFVGFFVAVLIWIWWNYVERQASYNW